MFAMPSFDVVSKIDMQEVDNSINTIRREFENRYDFKNINWSVEFDRKEKTITLLAGSDYCLQQIQLSLKAIFAKRKLDPLSLDFQENEKAAAGALRQIIRIKEGIDQDNGREITKFFKQSKLRVQVSIRGDEVRVSGKSRNDLQEAIQNIKDLNLKIPLQFINFRE
ncbi:MAG: YajQ family cyclic di-GMP-binding protein [Rickettsiales bacterium]|jgi:uncharacterized protein YajQ (UPF0234 family)|nr:YajQ family cyclic di-GMP-binding protein [Rickettsiales bacterium]